MPGDEGAAAGWAAGVGADPDPSWEEAAGIIRSVAAGLTPQRAATYLASPRVAEVVGRVS